MLSNSCDLFYFYLVSFDSVDAFNAWKICPNHLAISMQIELCLALAPTHPYRHEPLLSDILVKLDSHTALDFAYLLEERTVLA